MRSARPTPVVLTENIHLQLEPLVQWWAVAIVQLSILSRTEVASLLRATSITNDKIVLDPVRIKGSQDLTDVLALACRTRGCSVGHRLLQGCCHRREFGLVDS
jgi:hypothetical protein